MTNNDVLRRIRYTFNLRDSKVVDIFKLVNSQVTVPQVKNWLLKDDDDNMVPLADVELSNFLNGFIIEKRGRKEGALPKPETTLTKNLMLMKLKIALELQNDDILKLMENTGFTIGKAELTAFFRKPDHKNYRLCKSQFLRNFLQAVQDKYHVELKKSFTPKVQSTNTSAADKKGTKPNNRDGKPFHKKDKTPEKETPKQRYVNPNAKPAVKSSSRRVLKLKPEDIYKDSH